MAMPASGLLYIISGSSVCRSICGALACASGDLVTLGVTAGKTAPYTMSSFYSFCRENSYKCVGLNQISVAGTDGTASSCRTDCICSNSAMVADQCYTVTICNCLCVGTGTGSLAIACGCCNTARLYCCRILNNNPAVNFSCSFPVVQGDTICTMICALHPVPDGFGKSCSFECITAVAATRGLFCRAASPITCSVCTCS
jgi:hypothetical protein